MKSYYAANRARQNKRGVSPIIATILLVAITVVLAAVLYILVSGLIGGTKSTTVDIAPAFSSSTGVGSCGSSVNTYNVTLNPSATATTATFGMTLTASSGAILSALAPITNGAAPNLVATLGGGCGAGTASAWYGVLWTSAGVPVAVYGSGGTNGWTALIGSTLPVTVASGMQLEIITSSSSASTDNFNCVGINGNSVTGTTAL